MKMRLNLCRAFLNKPDLLFLDEPMSLGNIKFLRKKDLIYLYKKIMKEYGNKAKIQGYLTCPVYLNIV
ncbi:MAG: hypothetical protein ACOC4G_11085 [Bacillota bacterium]